MLSPPIYTQTLCVAQVSTLPLGCSGYKYRLSSVLSILSGLLSCRVAGRRASESLQMQMDLKAPVIVLVLLVSMMESALSATLSLPAGGQYSFRPFDRTQYIKDMVEYLNQTKTKPTTTTRGHRNMNDQNTNVDCNMGNWTMWGPKTRLFRCGEQYKERNGCNKTEVERRLVCKLNGVVVFFCVLWSALFTPTSARGFLRANS